MVNLCLAFLKFLLCVSWSLIDRRYLFYPALGVIKVPAVLFNFAYALQAGKQEFHDSNVHGA